MSALQPLVFDDTVFTVVDRDGEPWLRLSEIALALQYDDPRACNKLYARNADEFTAEETSLIKLPDLRGRIDPAGQNREVRIFSLRGAQLLAIFARTPPAKRFRRWVLDVLEGKAQPARAAQPAAQQGDLFGGAVPLAFDELTLLRQLHATQTRLVQLLEEQIKGRRRTRPQPLTVDEIKLARSLKAQGVSQSAIARHMGRSQATISLILRDLH